MEKKQTNKNITLQIFYEEGKIRYESKEEYFPRYILYYFVLFSQCIFLLIQKEENNSSSL